MLKKYFFPEPIQVITIGDEGGMAALFRQLGEFCAEKEDWTQYAKRLKYFFDANDVQDEIRKKALLMTSVGPATFKQLTNLVAPDSLDDKTYKGLVEALQKYYNPNPTKVVQRYTFNTRFRKPGESVATYISELRAIAQFCNYGNTLDLMLRDRLVCGIN